MTGPFDAVFLDDEAAFNDAAIHRILGEVAETSQGKRLAEGCARDKLAERLASARVQWQVFSASHRRRAGRVDQRLATAFRRLAKSAKRFETDLLEEVIQEEVIARRWLSVFPTPPDLKAFLDILKRVISIAEGSTQTYEYRVKGRSLKEWFVGVLALIFKDCFGRSAGAGSGDKSARGDQDIYYGPFTRFAIAVMEEMGEDLSPDIVKRALRPPRRKHKQAKRLHKR